MNARKSIIFFPYLPPALGKIDSYADIGKFCLIVISVIVAVRVAAWLSTVLIVLGVIWMAYKLFLDSD